MKYNKEGKLAEVWETPIAGTPLFVPHKAILDSTESYLYVADRQNRRIVSFATTHGGRGSVFSDREELRGYPYAISLSGFEKDWQMYGVFGGRSKGRLMGFTLDSQGNVTGMWGPKLVGGVLFLLQPKHMSDSRVLFHT